MIDIEIEHEANKGMAKLPETVNNLQYWMARKDIERQFELLDQIKLAVDNQSKLLIQRLLYDRK